MWNNAVEALTNNKRVLIYIFIATFLLYFIFSPAINMLYYASDDFRYALPGANRSCSKDDCFYFVLSIGRPLQAYLDCLNFKFGFTMERMRLIRLVSIAFMGCGIGLLADWLVSLGFSFFGAFFAAGSVFLVQRLYDDTTSAGATSLPIALILVLLAYRSMGKTYLYSFFHTDQRLKKITWLTLSAALLMCSLLTYPAMAFFFATLILTKLLFSNFSAWIKTRREVIQEIMLFSGVCIAYFIYGYLNMRYHARAPIPEAYKLDHPNLSITEFVNRLAMLGNVFSRLWKVFPSDSLFLQGWITITLTIGGIIIAARNFIKGQGYANNKRVALMWLGQAILGTAALLVLSNTFFLIMPSLTLIELRFLFGTVAAGFMLVFWSIMQWSQLFSASSRKNIVNGTIFILFLLQCYQANLFMTARAVSFVQYTDFAKNAISTYLAKQPPPQRIHFIVDRSYYPYEAFFLTNGAFVKIFGRSDYKFKWCSLLRGVPGAEKDHQAEALKCIKTLPDNKIAVTYTYPDEPFIKTDHMLLIDIQNVRREQLFAEYLKNNFNIEGWTI